MSHQIQQTLFRVQSYLLGCLPGQKIYVAARISPNSLICTYHVVINDKRGGEAYESWADFTDLIDTILTKYRITRVEQYIRCKGLWHD